MNDSEKLFMEKKRQVIEKKAEIKDAVALISTLKEDIKELLPNIWHMMLEGDLYELTEGAIPKMWIKENRAKDRKEKGLS